MKILNLILTILLAASVIQAADADFEKYLDETPTWSATDQTETQAFRKELAEQVQAYLDLADNDTLMPVIIQRGIGGYLECFGNPAEIAASLVDVAPLLPEDLATRAKAHAVKLIEKYPPWDVCWSNDGPDGSWYLRPGDLKPAKHEFRNVPLGNLYLLWKVVNATGETKLVDENWSTITRLYGTLGRKPKPVKVELVDLWHRPSDAAPMKDIFGRLCVGAIHPGTLKMTVKYGEGNKTSEVFTDDGKGKLVGEKGSTGTIDYTDGAYEISLKEATTQKRIAFTCEADGILLYGDVAGHIGYARLAKMLDKPEAKFARDQAIWALEQAAEYGFNTMYQMSNREFFDNNAHDGMYCPLHIIRSGRGRLPVSVVFADEVGRMLKDTQAEDVDSHVEAYINVAGARAWWQNHGLPGADTVNTDQIDVPGGDGFGGENCCMGPGIGWTFYMLKAYVADAPKEKLRMWIDVPWARVGDNLHWLRLAACIRAHGQVDWAATAK